MQAAPDGEDSWRGDQARGRYSRVVIRVLYQGPPHPVRGLVSMLEDADFEVTYDPPGLEDRGSAEVELLLTDIQLAGVEGVQEVIQEFNDRHPDLPATVRILPVG